MSSGAESNDGQIEFAAQGCITAKGVRVEECGVKIDLLDPENYRTRHPYEMYRWLRENDPIHWHEEPQGPGFWALMRHADVRAMESDSETYSSEPLTVIVDSEPYGDADHKLLIYSDPPGHTVRRKFLGAELNPLPVRSQSAHMQEVVTEIIDEVIERGECDLVEEVAGRLASFVIADMMGLSRAEALELFPAAEILTRGLSAEDPEAAEATRVVFTHAARAWNDRRAHPGADWLSRLANGEVGGRPMDEMQFQLDFLLLINAGSDTTRNVVASGMGALFEHAEAYQDMAAARDDSLLASAVEEILRWTPPISYQRRTVTRDTELGGQKLAKGDKVAGFYGAANRDPAVFDDPDTFDIRRPVNPHLTFGAGRHFCLGSHLARLELITMFRELTRRIPDMQPAAPAEYYDYAELSATAGPKRMPVTFTPGPRIGTA